MNQLVSAVIATHNRKELLKGAIESVLKQTYQPLECIVVDDASADGTGEFIREYIDAGKVRYIYISKEESKGGNHARNIGIDAAKGEYIAFLDDDDEWFPEKIEAQMALTSRETRVVYTGFLRELDFTNRYDAFAGKEYLEGNLSKEILMRIIIIITSTLLVEKALLLETGCFDENLRYWQEYDLCIRLLQRTRVGCVKKPLVLYRVITTDKARLSNKMAGWEESVKQIERKYPHLIQSLTRRQENQRQMYICIDGLNRAMKTRSMRYLLKYAALYPLIHPGIIPEFWRKLKARTLRQKHD